MKAEYLRNQSCPQRDSTECKEYAGAHSACRSEDEEREHRSQSDHLMEKVVGISNMKRAIKRHPYFRQNRKYSQIKYKQDGRELTRNWSNYLPSFMIVHI
jgi:hypothetical protein